MVSYKLLTAIQAILIIICGFSVTDYGVTLASGGDQELVFNKLLFDSEDGIIGGTPLEDNDFWNSYTFWGYLFLVVGIIQIIKAFSGGP